MSVESVGAYVKKRVGPWPVQWAQACPFAGESERLEAAKVQVDWRPGDVPRPVWAAAEG